MAGRVLGRVAATVATLMLSVALARVASKPWSGDANATMCDPPVLLFTSLGLGLPGSIVISVGGLNETAPLFGLDHKGNNWTTKWVNLTKEDPEMRFLLEQEKLVSMIQTGLDNRPDFVTLRVECPVTDNLTCIFRYTVDDTTLSMCNGNCDVSLESVIKDGLSKWIDVDILRNHTQELKDRWGPVCGNIANVSDPGHLTLVATVGNGWLTCSAWTPSPVLFWLSTNTSVPAPTINSTYTKMNETGMAFINVTLNNGTWPPACIADSRLGWSVTTTATLTRTVVGEPSPPPQTTVGESSPSPRTTVGESPRPTDVNESSPSLQRLVGRRGAAESKDDCGSHEFQLVVVVLIVAFLGLLVIYLFFKERIHVWVREKILSRFGGAAKPVSRVGFRPVTCTADPPHERE